VTLTKSLSKRAFWYVQDDHRRAIKTGEYVVFNHFVPRPAHSKDTFIERSVFSMFTSKDPMMKLTFIKRVGCSAGETLTVDGDYYYCNGTYLGRAKHRSRAGEKVEPFHFSGAVPAGMIFAIGDHPDSFDSRYYGFIPRDQILEVAWPLY